jgi:hypothetical protein
VFFIRNKSKANRRSERAMEAQRTIAISREEFVTRKTNDFHLPFVMLIVASCAKRRWQ